MKRTYPQKNKPVQASEIDRDGSAEPSKQTTLSTGSFRSLATIGLAISVGASGILLPRNGDSARASELTPTAESTVELKPVSTNGPATTGQVDGSSAEQAGVKVQQGQTLWDLSRDYEIEPKALATANGIKPDTALQVGQELRIPEALEASPQENPGNTATVNPEQKLNLTGSESLDSAAQYGQSTEAPDMATTVPTQSSIDSPNADGAIDSLKKQENRTTASGRPLLDSEVGPNSSTPAVPTLASPEYATSPAIPDLRATPVIPNASVGQAASPDRSLESIEQSLATPSLPSAVVVSPAGSSAGPAQGLYNVRPGDTLDAIASNYRVSPKELIAVNKLGNPNLLNVNQRLKIPNVRSNNPAVQAAASDSASNSTSVWSATSVPASLNPSSSTSEITSAGVAAPAPKVAVVSPLANLEGLNNISAPMVPKINSIPLTQVSQTISDNRKLELQGEPTFTGAVDTSALPQPASATATNLAAAYPQPFGLQNVSAQGLNPAPTNAVLESNAEDLPTATALNPYSERLRAEVVRLREEYRAERNSIGANAVSLAPTEGPEAKLASNPSEELPSVNPDLYTPEYAGAVQNEIGRPPSRGWSQEVQKQQQERFDPARAAELQPINLTPTSTQERPVVATAPLGSEGYDPLSNPSLGRMVSPELPPLSGADTYLPNGGGKQQSANGLIWPAKGVLTSGYGWRWGRMHKGIDIAGPIGTPIVAADSGVVTYADWNDGGYGYLVEITHPDGSETIYAHNNRILVKKGQQVDRGEQIAEMGSTGFSTGPHLHFEIHPAGQGAVNPMAFLPNDTSSASR
ncbi:MULTISPECIES: peptidoglycan DD-metalloendopeptidase family protein [unclassified Microcoleus]|uniref:peptidoglycan DD-metalloendopeptidase family protein n=1 Tax=unclassified Microcoleus TaxID=2642155 RepID=UPI001E032A08|nr:MULTISPECIES: peptidoglycan DD-metalloendopeptidase family protein [unclassified Microcoleus]MCC3595374.1 peptidoglycan DD-metalloendopeptidase family protein [Microcoleus sp. PH2017_26_ELK_O_A]MCC3620369.1 peptidoglycan DD-metalloendopeptidase family protein [Microcoleus sp. PH2017_36_ELK_O_B]